MPDDLRGNVMSADCPSRPILNHMTSRWGVLVLLALDARTMRFSALRRAIGGISERMLAQTLQTLESDGLVQRTAHAVVPPHVDYDLTAFGREAVGHLRPLVDWLEGRLPQLLGASAR